VEDRCSYAPHCGEDVHYLFERLAFADVADELEERTLRDGHEDRWIAGGYWLQALAVWERFFEQVSRLIRIPEMVFDPVRELV
jgi:hypothetical protein